MGYCTQGRIWFCAGPSLVPHNHLVWLVTLYEKHFHIREHFPALLNCLWAADVHYRPSAFSLELNLAEARPVCCGAKTAWDRDLVSLGGAALAPTVGPSRAALGPTACWQRDTPLAGVGLLALELLLPARHAACGGRGDRKRVR